MKQTFISSKKKFTFTFLVATIFSSYTVGVVPQKNSLKIIATAGMLNQSAPYDAFYKSKLFASSVDKAPFVIANGNAKVYKFGSTLFFVSGGLKAKDVVEAAASFSTGSKSVSVMGLLGTSFRAIPLSEKNTRVSKEWQQYLGAAQSGYAWHKVDFKGQRIFAINVVGSFRPTSWPTSVSDLKRIPAVLVQNSNGLKALVIARAVSTFNQKKQKVEQLLSKNQGSHFVDVGVGAIMDRANRKAREGMVTSLKPAAVFPSISEIATLNKRTINPDIPYCFPIGNYMEQGALFGGKGQKSIRYFSLAHNEGAWPLLKDIGDANNLSQLIKRMKANGPADESLNIVQVFSEEAASAVAQEIDVDLVLMVSEQINLSLGDVTFDLRVSLVDSKEQISPIIKISPYDVTEIDLLTGNDGTLDRVRVLRHNLSDVDFLEGAGDVNAQSRLFEDGPKVSLTRVDLDSLFGALITKHTKADIAVFEESSLVTPVKTNMTKAMLESLLARQGRLSTIRVSAKQVKNFMGKVKSGAFSTKYSAYGYNVKSGFINKRRPYDREMITVALTEKALLEIFGVAMVGGLKDQYSSRATFIEAFQVDVTGLYYLSGPKILEVADSERAVSKAVGEIGAHEAISQILPGAIDDMADEQVADWIANPYGKLGHSLSLNIDYIDFGFSTNMGNEQYEEYQSNDSLPIGRGRVPSYTHLLIYTKMDLVYDAPGLITSLENGVKYLHTDEFNKPEKDKVTFGLNFRLPWERSLFKDKPIIISPILLNAFETKLFPIPGISRHNSVEWQGKKVSPRTKRLDNQLGFRFDAIKNLGFSFDVVGVLSTDFRQTGTANMMDLGVGLLANGRWSLIGPLQLGTNIKSYYMFGLPKSTVSDQKLALRTEGSVKLRLAKFYDFSLSLMGDFLLASLQSRPKDIAFSSIYAVTISYGSAFRFF